MTSCTVMLQTREDGEDLRPSLQAGAGRRPRRRQTGVTKAVRGQHLSREVCHHGGGGSNGENH